MTTTPGPGTEGRPTLAAVVVNYNYARYLPDAIDSVLDQSTPFDTVIAVDDGSTDDSLGVLARYGDAITVLDIPNGGQLGACLAGLAATSADYVYFLDADDYAHPDLVTTLSPLLAAAPAKVQFRLEGVSATAGPLESIFPSYPQRYDATRMRADNATMGFYICPPTSGNVYQRQALLRLPLDMLEHRDFIDGPATLAMPYLGDVESVDAVLASYRVHGDNHSQWAEPSVTLLTHEVEWFERRWVEATRLLDMAAPPFGRRRPLYLLERELMIAALAGEGTVRPAGRYVLRLMRTNVPPRQKIMLVAWALGLAVPMGRVRSALVRARRSPLNRSTRLRRVLRLLLQGRRERPRSTAAASP